jgi:hypothetical protein
VQPFAAVPVTTYVLVEAGTKEIPSAILSVQLYDKAPVPFNVTGVPEHTVDPGDTVEPTVGLLLTVIVTELVLEHPLLVPVTV